MSDLTKNTEDQAPSKRTSDLAMERTRTSAQPGFGVYLRALARDKITLVAAIVLSVIVFVAVFANFVAPFPPDAQDLALRNQPPMTDSDEGFFPHVLGTDPLGRDQLTRLMYGARVSIAVGVLSVLVSGVSGVLLGLASGYYRGIVDDIAMRAVDIQMAFPGLLLALLVLYALGASVINVIIVLAVTRWALYARITRGIVLSQRENVYVEAARSVGCSDRRVLLVHILPNIISPLLVLGTLETAILILSEASLSFLGLGIQPPDSSWGLMLSEGREYLRTSWWLLAFPGLSIMLTALSLNLLAVWFRNVTDPVQRWRFLRSRKEAKAAEEA